MTEVDATIVCLQKRSVERKSETNEQMECEMRRVRSTNDGILAKNW
jgi:hypothetical protein